MRKLGLAGLALALALTRPAFAGDPNTPKIGPDLGPKAKFEKALATLPELEAAAWRTRVTSGEVPARDALHRLLLEKVPAYKAAITAFDKDASNAEDFAKLEATDAGALSLALHAHATYFEGRARLNRDEFDTACQLFDKVRRDLAAGSTWIDEATFYLGYSYARRPELEADRERLFRARARHCLEALAPDFAEQKQDSWQRVTYSAVPERDREAAVWLIRELRGEGSGPLLELARRMDTIERAIDHEHTGKPTQQKQKAVIAELDRLIELLRQKEQGGDGSGQGGGKQGRQSQQGGQNAGSPANRSSLPNNGLTPGDPTKSKVQGSADWGNLPEKERESVLQALKEKFPERYKELVEQYMKSLADDAGKRPAAREKSDTPPPQPDNKAPEKKSGE